MLPPFKPEEPFFEVEVRHRGATDSERDFFFANVLDEVDCFDFEHSDYEMDEKEGWTHCATAIEHLSIDDEKAHGHHLFMISKVWMTSNLCVSEELAAAVLARGITGVVFVKPADYRAFPIDSVAWSPNDK